MKIVLIRLDKIGDLIATLPVDQIPELREHEVRWVISRGLGLIARKADPPREALELALDQPAESERQLIEYLRQGKPDLVVFFYGPWWAARGVWRAGVPRRFGRRSQWFSYLFFNGGLRQKRSLGEKHESQYNLDLVRAALALAPASGDAPLFRLRAPELRHLYEKFELKSDDYYVVHPGMAGSALNWPVEHYLDLIQRLAAEKQVVITGTGGDEKWIAPLRPVLDRHPRVQILQDQLSMEELLFVLKNASAVVGPSTGVVHLAASLGTRTLGLYSPLAAQHPRRWAARGEKVKILSPTLEQVRALPEPSLAAVSPDEVLAWLQSPVS